MPERRKLQKHEFLRFLVPSESNPKREYLVDLLSYKGKGKCTCADWSIRCWPNIRDKTEGRTDCKHLRRCRSWLRRLLKADDDTWPGIVISELARRNKPHHDEE